MKKGGFRTMRKHVHTFKAAVLYAALAALLMMTGCGSDELSTSAKIYIQLTDAAIPYPVDQMTVTIQKAGGPAKTGTTNASGVATITVDETGAYDVTQVTGVDATTLAEGSVAGREFKKTNPMGNPYPYLTYIVPALSVNVTSLGQNYNVNAPVPLINKVTVLKVGSAVSADSGEVTVTTGTAAFAGRVMISNLNCNDNTAGLQIVSSDVNGNRMHLYINITPVPPGTFGITDTWFFGGPADLPTHTGFVNSYTQAGPIYFEAPGTDSGDWALGYHLSLDPLDLKIRNAFGGADPTRNFPAFDGGVGNFVLRTWSTAGGGGHVYSFDYRIFQFDEY